LLPFYDEDTKVTYKSRFTFLYTMVNVADFLSESREVIQQNEIYTFYVDNAEGIICKVLTAA